MTDIKAEIEKELSLVYNTAWLEGSNYEANNCEGASIPSAKEVKRLSLATQAIITTIEAALRSVVPEKREERATSPMEAVADGTFNYAIDQINKNIDQLISELRPAPQSKNKDLR